MTLIFSLLPLEFFISEFCCFNYDVLGIGLFLIWVHFVGIFLFTISPNVVSFFSFRNFSAMFYQIYFWPLSLSWDPYNANADMLDVVPEVIKLFSTFYCSFSCCCSDWVISVILSSKSLMHSSSSPDLLKSPSIHILYLSYYILQLWLGSFLYF